MIKNAFSISMVVLGMSISNCSHRLDSSVLIWSRQKKLRWEDFQGIPPKVTKEAALSTTQILLDYRLKNNRLKRFRTICIFIKPQSWYNATSDGILAHEQGHFDLTEIYSLLLVNRLRKLDNRDSTSSDVKIHNIFNIYLDSLNRIQDKYDEETRHSIDTLNQAWWNKKIHYLLDSLRK